MPLTKPLMNNVLVEVHRDYDGVSRTDENESMKFGVLIDYSVDRYHVTASAGLGFDQEWWNGKNAELERFKGHIVRWEEFAEGGQTFEEDGKTYAIIPWWRLISVTETNNDKEI